MVPPIRISCLIGATSTSSGSFSGLVPNYRYIDKANEVCNTGSCHPSYVLDADVANGLMDFVNETLEKFNSGDKCGE